MRRARRAQRIGVAFRRLASHGIVAMNIENRLRAAINKAVQLQQAIESLVSHLPPQLKKRGEELDDRADTLASDLSELLHKTEVLRDG